MKQNAAYHRSVGKVIRKIPRSLLFSLFFLCLFFITHTTSYPSHEKQCISYYTKKRPLCVRHLKQIKNDYRKNSIIKFFTTAVFNCRKSYSKQKKREGLIYKASHYFLPSDRRDSNPRPRPWQGRTPPTEPLSRLRTLKTTYIF